MHLYRLEVTGVDRVFVFFGGEIPRTPTWKLCSLEDEMWQAIL